MKNAPRGCARFLQNGGNMKQDDIAILKEIQKNTKMAMMMIDTLLDKVEDNTFVWVLSKQSVGYAKIHNDAVEKLIEEKQEAYRGSQISDMLLRGNIHANTFWNTSISHLAEMMIQESNKEMTNIYKSMKYHTKAEDFSVELAKELMDFETKNMELMKQYL